MKTLINLVLFLFFLNSINGQVYPYYYYPHKGYTKDVKCGLVSKNRIKITEPIFENIDPFLNQKENNYSIFHRNIEVSKDGKKKHIQIKGIIDNSGKIITGIEGTELRYNGNGRIVQIFNHGVIELWNIKLKTKIFEQSNVQIKEIISGKIYYIIIRETEDGHYFIIDENGKSIIPKERKSGRLTKLEMVDEIIFKEDRGYNGTKYYNISGVEIKKLPENLDNPYFISMDINDNEHINESEIQLMIKNKYPDCLFNKYYKDKFGKIQLIEIKKDQHLGLISKKGEQILECNNRSIEMLYTDFDQDNKNDKMYLVYNHMYSYEGLLSISGQILLKPNYGMIQAVNNANLFSLMAPKFRGYCSRNGELFLPNECKCFE